MKAHKNSIGLTETPVLRCLNLHLSEGVALRAKECVVSVLLRETRGSQRP